MITDKYVCSLIKFGLPCVNLGIRVNYNKCFYGHPLYRLIIYSCVEDIDFAKRTDHFGLNAPIHDTISMENVGTSQNPYVYSFHKAI